MAVAWGAEEVRRLDDMFVEYDVACISAIFSWDVPRLIEQARIALEVGKRVMVGGGGTYQHRHWIKRELGIEAHWQTHAELDGVEAQFKMVYFTRGCVEKCWFCIVPKIEGGRITLNRASNPAPLLLDNNLSEIPREYQEYIVERYLSSDVGRVDANSGFEPKGITTELVELWSRIPLLYWRIGFDEIAEEKAWEESVRTIKETSKKKVRVYCMIGHEPIDQCRYRCERIIAMGCEPVPQAFIPLSAMRKEPKLMHDWTADRLRQFQRFYYRPHLWRGSKLEDYERWNKAVRRQFAPLQTMMACR